MKILVTGGTGLIGTALVNRLLLDEHKVTITSRHEAQFNLPPEVTLVVWDPSAEALPINALRDVEAVVHLAGESLASGRWTKKKKKNILTSRVKSTRNLVQTLNQSPQTLKSFICASAIGIYGNRNSETITESSPIADTGPANDFLASVCFSWEAEAKKINPNKVEQLVNLRTGIILSKDGGALKKILPPFRFGLGGKLGDGDQWMSWIHIDDCVNLISFLLTRKPPLSGAINATAPNPTTNLEFTSILGNLLHKPTFLSVPAFALEILLGQFSKALLEGQKVLPSMALKAGFQFRHPTLEGALADLLSL